MQSEPDDENNKRLEAVKNALDKIDTDAVDHAKAAQLVKTAAGAELAALMREEWIGKLWVRLKDSILAVKLLGREQVTGLLETQCSRLRTIETIRKIAEDGSFPFDGEDLGMWRAVPIVVPTLADFKSILSAAQKMQGWRKSLEENIKKNQVIADTLFGQRRRLTETMQSLKTVSAAQRITKPPAAVTLPKLPDKLTPFAVAR